MKETRPDSPMSYLDTLVMPQSDGTLATTVSGSQVTLANICCGIANTPSLPNTVWPEHSVTGSRLYFPTKSYCSKNITCKKCWQNVNITYEPWIGWKSRRISSQILGTITTVAATNRATSHLAPTRRHM